MLDVLFVGCMMLVIVYWLGMICNVDCIVVM